MKRGNVSGYMPLAKKVFTGLVFCCAVICFIGCGNSKKENADGKVTIGIAKIVQHEALDAVEQGIMDALDVRGIDAEYDLQNANNDVNAASQIAAQFKREQVAAAVGIATPVAVALANAITDIPVVFSVITDPVGAGLVTTVEHGEGNVTGLSDAQPIPEHIALFKEIAGIKTLGYIYTSSEANSISALSLVEEACAAQGINLVTQSITNSAEVRQAAEAIVGRVDGIYLTTDNTVFSAHPALIQVFAENRKPAFSVDVTSAMDGGLMIASGFNYYKAGLATGDLVADILEGAKPAETPVRFITDPLQSDLVIDLDAAANCGITIPQKYVDMAGFVFTGGKMETR
ncbi:MAG: ABC transporter substrate-binding protein [Spirochaetaceae bacterium]|nr:ABC transporter substrate-binding protein [Spirochaetaceae bacterium]